jgi:hypothetical protein
MVITPRGFAVPLGTFINIPSLTLAHNTGTIPAFTCGDIMEYSGHDSMSSRWEVYKVFVKWYTEVEQRTPWITKRFFVSFYLLSWGISLA